MGWVLEGILCHQVQHSQCWCEVLLWPSRDVSLVGALSAVRGPEPEEAPEATPGRRSCWQIPHGFSREQGGAGAAERGGCCVSL